MLGILIFAVYIYSANAVQGQKEIYNDCVSAECLKGCAQNVFNELTSETIEGVGPWDPLKVDSIVSDTKNLKMILYNATFTGFKSCSPELIKFSTTDLSYKYNLACKHLVLEGEYTMRGYLLSHFVEGNGDFKIDYHDFVFLLNAEYEEYLDDKNRVYMHVKGFKYDVDPRGKAVFEFKNMYNGDSEKHEIFHNFATENWKAVEKEIRYPIMDKITSLSFSNTNKYFKAVTSKHVFNCEDS